MPVYGQDPASEMPTRSEEHTSELQSQSNLVCRLLLEKKKIHSRRSLDVDDEHDALMLLQLSLNQTELRIHAGSVLGAAFQTGDDQHQHVIVVDCLRPR